ncbi:MAG: hypothetical protein LCH53_08960 [Bacteroidetes bacterium]|nr:hypothetical protein [Bacteroidota bacterium]
MNRALFVGLALVGATGCDVLSPRTPEDPSSDPVVFVQPDTPETVVENLERAVAARDAGAYRRSLADAFAFTPTPDAATRYPVWNGWDRVTEETATRALFVAAQSGAVYTLRLDGQTAEDVSDSRYVLAARYTLSVPHVRPDAPTIVQGRLRWTLVRGSDGLWALAAWTDEPDASGAASWSDLKAAFAR